MDWLSQGIDFFFAKRSHAIKFVDFLNSVVPIRYRNDKQLVSHNEQNASYNYKYTFSVEIVPICKVSVHLWWCCRWLCCNSLRHVRTCTCILSPAPAEA